MAPHRQAGTTVVKESSTAYSTREKGELLLFNLEKLKTRVADIEARYSILKADYTSICVDVMSRIDATNTGVERNPASELSEPGPSEPEMSSFKPGLHLALDNRLLQLVAPREPACHTRGKMLSLIDKAGDCIEFGLDKVGDAIIFAGDRISHALFR